MSNDCPSHISTQADDNLLTIFNKELSLIELLLLIDNIWNAFEKSISPDSIAKGIPNFAQTVTFTLV